MDDIKKKFAKSLIFAHETLTDKIGSEIVTERQRKTVYAIVACRYTNFRPDSLDPAMREVGERYVAGGLEAIRD